MTTKNPAAETLTARPPFQSDEYVKWAFAQGWRPSGPGLSLPISAPLHVWIVRCGRKAVESGDRELAALCREAAGHSA